MNSSLVTGGGGFIGSHLVERLVARGDRVVVVDNFSTGRRGNLANVPADQVAVVDADVSTGIAGLEPGAFDEIYHLAAAVGVRLVIEQPIQTIETNVHETSAILRFASVTRTPLLLASTSEIYGKSDKMPFAEEDDVVYGPTTLHRWSYACSKAIDEYLTLAYHREQGLPATIVRLFNTVGPRQVGDYGMVLPRFVAAALAGRPLEVYGDGAQTRCFCDVRDVVGLLSTMLANPKCIGGVFNVGNDAPISIRALAQTVVEVLESPSPIVTVPYDRAFGAGFDDLRDRRPDLTRVQAATGFAPTTPLSDTIRDVAAELSSAPGIGALMISLLGQAEPALPVDEAAAAAAAPIVEAPTAGIGAVGLELLNSSAHLFLAAFLVTLLATPLVRRIAIAAGVIDMPDADRKLHPYPVAYLGGVAVFLGLLAAILLSYLLVPRGLPTEHSRVPLAVVIGMVAITFTGLADDVWGWDPRLKIAGQLVAAAALAINDVGVHVAAGVLQPFMGGADTVLFTVAGFHVLAGHLYYWLGTALIAVFVLGGCNSANLIDGLDGLLSGVVGVVAIGLLVICLLVVPTYERELAQVEEAVSTVRAQVARYEVERMHRPRSIADLVHEGFLEEEPSLPAGWSLPYDPSLGVVVALNESRVTAYRVRDAAQERVRLLRDTALPTSIEALMADLGGPEMPEGFSLRYDPNTGRVRVQEPDSPMSGSRTILCLALLGAVLGFLPHNFRPASIFLGDCGSLLLGYMCVVIILMLGDRGQTYFVFAGLIVFAVPIIDTTLAIIRRILARTPLSAGDDHHLHHQLKRALGGVSRAVLALYGISALFAAVGILLVVLHLHGLRVRVMYAIALLMFSFIGMIAVKEAQRQKVQAAALAAADRESKS